ncbi:MAG: hypothetical protein WA855_17525 [Candidatus Acidiferrales bacterium]
MNSESVAKRPAVIPATGTRNVASGALMWDGLVHIAFWSSKKCFGAERSEFMYLSSLEESGFKSSPIVSELLAPFFACFFSVAVVGTNCPERGATDCPLAVIVVPATKIAVVMQINPKPLGTKKIPQ